MCLGALKDNPSERIVSRLVPQLFKEADFKGIFSPIRSRSPMSSASFALREAW